MTATPTVKVFGFAIMRRATLKAGLFLTSRSLTVFRLQQLHDDCPLLLGCHYRSVTLVVSAF